MYFRQSLLRISADGVVVVVCSGQHVHECVQIHSYITDERDEWIEGRVVGIFHLRNPRTTVQSG